MPPFIPGQFGQCARYGRLITHFLPVCLSDSGEKMEGLRGNEKEGRGGGESAEEGWDMMGVKHKKQKEGKGINVEKDRQKRLHGEERNISSM